jgi:hypothetical protein
VLKVCIRSCFVFPILSASGCDLTAPRASPSA